ncbi:MAG: GNAT family N-acetyltransferase [Pseudomonadota bacterium]
MIRRALPEELPALLEIRRIVFIEGQNVPEHEERDGRDDDALHFIALNGTHPIGTARALVENGFAKIGRVAVLENHRGVGIGTGLMRTVLDDLRASGLARAKLGAQTHAIGFYEALGFTAEGPEFLDAGIPHRTMTLDL